MKLPKKIEAIFLSQKKKEAERKRKALTDNASPYLNARRTWNEHVGSLVDAKQIWQAVAIGSCLIAVASVGGMTYIGSQSKIIPYIVEVPKNNLPIPLGMANMPSPVNDLVIQSEINRFIEDIRMVTPDMLMERMITKRVYAHLLTGTPAFAKTNEIYKSDQRPETRSVDTIVDVQITDTLKQSPTTWQVDWIETVMARNGKVKDRFLMKALMTIKILPPLSSSETENLRLNPLGIFVDSYSWSKAS